MSSPAPGATPGRRPRRRFLPEPGPIATGIVLLLGAAVLFGAYLLLDPTPDKHIVMATGPAQGAYAEFAKRYVPLLRERGVTLELRPTGGSNENLALLRDPGAGVQVAFVQGGVEAPDEAPEFVDPPLLSLGSVAFEPLWLFYREDSSGRPIGSAAPTRLADLAGWRIDTGPAGGGTLPLLLQLVETGGLPLQGLRGGDASTVDGVVGLVQGRFDALALVSAADAPFVQAEAYARRFGFLHALRLPRGLIDPVADRPPQDMHLVAATASLVTRADLHPALMELLVQAASRVHGRQGWFARQGEFPNLDAPIFPLAREAQRFHRDGAPWLQRYLPFWLANFFDRMWIVLLPLLAALLPLSRVLPPLVELRLRSRVFRWYGQLRTLEEARGQRSPEELGEELDTIEARVAEIDVPLSYADELYALRSHIAMVRRRLSQPGVADRPSA